MKIKKLTRYALPVALASGVCLSGHAQSATDGAIGGTVVDTTGLPVSHATIVIRSNTTNAEQATTADDSGFFRMVHLPASAFTVKVSAPGFQNYESKEVIVQVGLLTDISPKLTVGSTSETVEVTQRGADPEHGLARFRERDPSAHPAGPSGQQLSLVRLCSAHPRRGGGLQRIRSAELPRSEHPDEQRHDRRRGRQSGLLL